MCLEGFDSASSAKRSYLRNSAFSKVSSEHVTRAEFPSETRCVVQVSCTQCQPVPDVRGKARRQITGLFHRYLIRSFLHGAEPGIRVSP